MVLIRFSFIPVFQNRYPAFVSILHHELIRRGILLQNDIALVEARAQKMGFSFAETLIQSGILLEEELFQLMLSMGATDATQPWRALRDAPPRRTSAG